MTNRELPLSSDMSLACLAKGPVWFTMADSR